MGKIIKIKDKYKPLWEKDYYIAIVTGGRGSGKSFAVGSFIENLSFEKGHRILFTRYTLDSASDSIIPEFIEKVEIEGHYNYFDVTKRDVVNTLSGSEILFRGIKTSSGNQTAKLKSIEGLTTWVLEEAEELTEKETYDKIKQSIRKKGIANRIIFILNPADVNHWIYKEFFQNQQVNDDFNGVIGNTLYIHSTYLDNLENLSSEFIEEAEKCKKYTPFIYDNQYLGKWIRSKENAIFKFRNLKKYKEINDEGAMLMCIDTADEGKDHFAGLICRYINGNVYVIDAVYNTMNLTVNEEIITERIKRYDIDRVEIETNSFGMYFLRRLREMNPNTPITGTASKSNKMGRILAQAGFILEFFHFPENPNEELKEFINQMIQVTPETKDDDDAADCMALMAAWVRKLYRT